MAQSSGRGLRNTRCREVAFSLCHLTFTDLESGHVSVRVETPPGTTSDEYRGQVAKKGFDFAGTRYTRWSVATKTIGGLFRNVPKGSVVGFFVALGQNLWEFGTNPAEGATFLERTVNNREFWVSWGVDTAASVVAGLAAAAVVGLAIAASPVTVPLSAAILVTAIGASFIGVGLEALGVPQWAKSLLNALFADR